MSTGQTTLITAAGTTESLDRYGCPGVHAVSGRTQRFVITREVEDPEVIEILRPYIGVDEHGIPEHLSSVPAWVPSLLMDLPILGAFIEATAYQVGDSVFRMECLSMQLVQMVMIITVGSRERTNLLGPGNGSG
jgi:hypothetical protein